MYKIFTDRFITKLYLAEILVGALVFWILLLNAFSPTGFVLSFSFSFAVILISPLLLPRPVYTDLFPNFWALAALAIPTFFTILWIRNQNVADFEFSIVASLLSTALCVSGIFVIAKLIYPDFSPGWRRIFSHGGWLLLPNFALMYQINFINPTEIGKVELTVVRKETSSRGCKYVELLERDGLTYLRISYPKNFSKLNSGDLVQVRTRKGVFGLKIQDIL